MQKRKGDAILGLVAPACLRLKTWPDLTAIPDATQPPSSARVSGCASHCLLQQQVPAKRRLRPGLLLGRGRTSGASFRPDSTRADKASQPEHPLPLPCAAVCLRSRAIQINDHVDGTVAATVVVTCQPRDRAELACDLSGSKCFGRTCVDFYLFIFLSTWLGVDNRKKRWQDQTAALCRFVCLVSSVRSHIDGASWWTTSVFWRLQVCSGQPEVADGAGSVSRSGSKNRAMLSSSRFMQTMNSTSGPGTVAVCWVGACASECERKSETSLGCVSCGWIRPLPHFVVLADFAAFGPADDLCSDHLPSSVSDNSPARDREAVGQRLRPSSDVRYSISSPPSVGAWFRFPGCIVSPTLQVCCRRNAPETESRARSKWRSTCFAADPMCMLQTPPSIGNGMLPDDQGCRTANFGQRVSSKK